MASERVCEKNHTDNKRAFVLGQYRVLLAISTGHLHRAVYAPSTDIVVITRVCDERFPTALESAFLIMTGDLYTYYQASVSRFGHKHRYT